jgi:glycosyltransferase involved in cell wall biosynthesis
LRETNERGIPVKVCFFSPTAYSYFNPRGATWAGGAEMQQLLLARHMLSKGIEVSFIVGDYGQPEVETFERVAVIRSFAPFSGNRKLRFVPDMLAIRRAMRIADADVYNQRSTSFFTGQLAFFASRLGRAFTFSAGMDYNAYPDCQGMLPWPMTALYRYGIAKADAVIAQTEKQRGLMTANFHRDVVVIRNGIALHAAPAGDATSPGAASRRPAGPSAGAPEFLWVGSFRRAKRPELFLELARRLPEARFTLIGGRGDNDPEYRDLPERAGAIPNLAFEGFVPPAEIERYYARAYALVNTSRLEGFPNTYLHSWLHGVPVLTIEIDPDAVIEGNGIGAAAGSLDGLVEAARALIANPASRKDMSARADAYVRKNHDIKDRGDDYIRLFETILEARRSRGLSRLPA